MVLRSAISHSQVVRLHYRERPHDQLTAVTTGALYFANMTTGLIVNNITINSCLNNGVYVDSTTLGTIQIANLNIISPNSSASGSVYAVNVQGGNSPR